MNNRLIVDTNIIAYFFEGDKYAGKIILEKDYSISAVTYIELLSNLRYSKVHRSVIKDFLNTTPIIQTIPSICDIAIDIRLSYNIKLPDAIIAATAHYLDLPLMTADQSFFKIKEIEIIKFNKQIGI